MTNEERIDKFDERIQSIAMHLELTASMAQATDQRIDRLLVAVEKDAESIRALARIAEIHERRLTDLEGGQRQ